ncbi:MAG: hypothetical protein RSA79_08025 [Oscillospiraceae bacterium]
MKYESIILELISRVQKLEEEVSKLKNSYSPMTDVNINLNKITDTQKAREYIQSLLDEAKNQGKEFIILKAGDIQKAIGLKNRPVIICNAMKQLMQKNDIIVEAPPSGFSTTVRIKYYL